MRHTFSDALAVVLREEGGFIVDPLDPGEMTNLGVTARTWHSWSGRQASEAVMRALTPAKVSPLYKSWYWDRVAGDQLPACLALPLFDFAVNTSPVVAAETLQGIVGAFRDSRLGPATLRAAKAYASSIGTAKLITRFCDARRDRYRELTMFSVFGKDWLARVDRIEAEAVSWVG